MSVAHVICNCPNNESCIISEIVWKNKPDNFRNIEMGIEKYVSSSQSFPANQTIKIKEAIIHIHPKYDFGFFTG